MFLTRNMITLLSRVFMVSLFIFFYVKKWSLSNPKGLLLFPSSLIADWGSKTVCVFVCLYGGVRGRWEGWIILLNSFFSAQNWRREKNCWYYVSANASATFTEADTFQRSRRAHVVFYLYALCGWYAASLSRAKDICLSVCECEHRSC